MMDDQHAEAIAKNLFRLTMLTELKELRDRVSNSMEAMLGIGKNLRSLGYNASEEDKDTALKLITIGKNNISWSVKKMRIIEEKLWGMPMTEDPSDDLAEALEILDRKK